MTNRKPRRTCKRNGPHPVDIHVGGKVRIQRVLAGLSQTQLASQMGLTFQQLQKYEKGANRISASRIWELSIILDVPVASFFDGIAGATEKKARPPALPARRTMNLVRNIDSCPAKVRNQLEAMARSFGRRESATQ